MRVLGSSEIPQFVHLGKQPLQRRPASEFDDFTGDFVDCRIATTREEIELTPLGRIATRLLLTLRHCPRVLYEIRRTLIADRISRRKFPALRARSTYRHRALTESLPALPAADRTEVFQLFRTAASANAQNKQWVQNVYPICFCLHKQSVFWKIYISSDYTLKLSTRTERI